MCDYIGSQLGDYEIFVYEVKIHKHIFQNYLTKNELAAMAPTCTFFQQIFGCRLNKGGINGI